MWLESRANLSLDEFGEAYRDWRLNRTQASRILDTLPDLTQALVVYGGYLEAIADLADEYGVRLVFVTQPTLWRADLTREEESMLWFGGVGDFQSEAGHEYFSSRVLAEAMRAYNSTLMDVCSNRSLECFDLAATFPKDTSVFFDDVHFTESGSKLFAEQLAET